MALMCKEVYRGEGIHVKMREVETYRKPSKTHTHTHTSTDTYPHTQSQSGTHFKDKLNEDFMAAGITSLSEKKKKKSLLFHFLFHDLTGATLTLSDLSGCLFVLGSCCEASF